MTGPALAVLAYAVVLGAPAAILAWPMIERVGRLPRTTSVVIAVVFWTGLVLPPMAGVVIDAGRAPRHCNPGDECPDYILWWFGIPLGWLLGVLIVIVAVAIGRHRQRVR